MLLHQQIELQATRTPDAVAVRYAGKSLTYAELDQHANRCARYLRELGVGPDVVVGVLMERSLELMVALLAILKAGGVYLPMDPSYPQSRLDFLLDDADVPAVITQSDFVGKIGDFAGTAFVLDLANDELAGYDGAPLEQVNGPDDLAYVIYTSGSTGQPKGCMLAHRAICNRLIWMQDMYRLTSSDRVLQKTPYTFDVSVWEFFWPLLAGATLVFAKPQGHKDSHYLVTTIREEGITVCHFVPSMLRFFLDDPKTPQCASLRDVFISGEALPFELVRRFEELLPARLHNLYGPTEAAVDVSYWECGIRADKLVPIGRAIANVQLHVLDEARQPVPRGQEGELYIAGVGLARGYLNRPELTEERFVPNPFGDSGSRMYRTGDRVRELDDGNLEFLGRMDFQVKLRGLRIELGEIESALRDFPGVNEAAVLVRGEEEDDPRLVAYLEPNGAAPDFRKVRDFIRERLPEYMVPNIVAVLNRLPVTAHGKLDRGALPWPVASGAQDSTTNAASPAVVPKADVTGEMRRRIADFIAGLLKNGKVEDEADLFDLGATSLTLMRLAEWIRQEYGIDVPVEHILDAPTVSGIAAYVAQFAGGIAEAAVEAGAQNPAIITRPVSSAPANRQEQDGALAIVGLSGRYPGAETLDAYWENLQSGVSSIAPMSAERLALLTLDGAQAVRAGSYLAQIDCFDNLLFGISPVEARTLDPQERLLLESAWACLEDAGYTAESFLQESPRVGVFMGAMWNDYLSHGMQVWDRRGRVEEFSYHATLANRISYLFNFSGPSVAINTSCSSGMTALHFACESIRRGECDAALVGGVNLIAHAYHAQWLETADILSKEDVCRPFSAQANGWILGEGVGTVLLKPVDAAVRDRDHIYAIVKGSAIGHSGRTARYTSPSAQQQEKTIRQTLVNAGLVPDDIDYVEAAAPGAAMADAAEISAVKAVFAGRKSQAPCYVGSVKANVGHLESASVFSQLTKVIHQLRHRRLAPSLNSLPRSPLIALDGTGLSIVEQPTPWSPAEGGRPLRAMINAVGAAGSEGHLVLEEYVAAARRSESGATTIVPLSAASEFQLKQQAQQLLDFLQSTPDTRLADLAFTLRVGRVAMSERLAFVVSDLAALREALAAYLSGEMRPADTWRGRAERGAEAVTAIGDLSVLAQGWVRGGKVDWDALPMDDAIRISLPTYPFERVSHWIGRAAGMEVEGVSLSAAQLAESDDRADPQLDAQLHKKVLAHLLRLVAGVTEVPLARLDGDAPLEGYGLTSLMVNVLNGKLEEDFGVSSKTLFFEIRTLRQLAEYVFQNHREAVSRLFGVELAARTAVSRVRLPNARGARAQGTTRNDEIIAIIGLGGRYPQAKDVDALWENLRAGVDSVIEIPWERWDHSRYFDSARNKPGKTYSKWGGFIDGVDEFDPLFFNIAPLHAEQMDPQERLLLQTAWQTIEDAGYSSEAISEVYGGRVGVFIGVTYGEYQLYPSLPGGLSVTGTYGTIANRVSYILDLCGPSMAVDTMCSSSLTSIHLACESIHRGECEMAIAGGVSLSLHPNKYITQALVNMSSSDGRCHAFGKGGDGFVPGEGVGTILLKPLSRAQADGDHIYGVIKATSLNHGGRTNGYTVPSPVAQANMVAHAIEQAGIHPRTISYIEAHGTGTALGDPIEITGLSKAFDQYTQDRQYCAIGSVKSNIGHCEGAAGIAGLTKILLQMKHGQLVPSLHSQELNPNIDFSATPFVVQQELADWLRPEVEIDGVRRQYPRRAGVSSFGAGGSNAHVIVEEYVAPLEARGDEHDGSVAVVLSAKNAERLQEQVRQFLEAVERGVVTEENLADAAYTLQVGRGAMEARLALLVETVEVLRDKLQRVLQGEEAIDDVYRGEIKKQKTEVAFFAADEDAERMVEAWLSKGKYGKLLELWVKGLSFDWNKLYGERKPRRISLPTYPFARDHYWVSAPADLPAPAGGAWTEALHPLLHRNTSTLSEQCFSTTFSGEEFFFTGHVAQGIKVLPAAAYLEMVRAAVAHATELASSDNQVWLRDVVFVRPAVVGTQGLTVHIALEAQDDDTIRFEIFSDGADEALVYSQGRAVIVSTAQAPEVSRPALSDVSLADVPPHRPLVTVNLGRDAWGQAFAVGQLALPAALQNGAAAFTLHPSLIDGALQAAGFVQGGPEGRVMMAFAIDEVQTYAPVPPSAEVIARSSQDSVSNGAVRKLDVDIVDSAGRLAVRIRGFSTRALEGTSPGLLPSDVAADETALVGELTLASVWEAMAPPDNESWPATDQGIVILGEDENALRVLLDRYPGAMICILDRADSIEAIADKLREQDAFSHVFWIVTPSPCADLRSDEIASAQKSGAVLGFRIVKALLSLGRDRMALGLTVVTTQSQSIASLQPIFPAHASVHGLIGSTAKEYPNWRVRLIDLPADEQWPLSSLLALPADAAGNAYLYRHGQWHQQRLIRCTLPAPEQPVYRRNGVYVILGGAGGIGEAYSEHLVRHYQAQIVWIGRRAEDATITEKCDRIAVHGVRPHYIRADAANAAELVAAYEQIKARFGEIHGVVHAMLVLADQSLVRMDEARFVSALIPKIDASINLVHAFGEEALDFVLFFSSMQSVIKAPGQSNYAAGSTFVDAYARAIGQTFPWKVKVVNWGYWGSIGVVASEEYRRRMEQFGIDSIEPPEAMEVLNRLLSASVDQVMFLKTKSKESALARDSVEGETLRALPPSSRALAALPQSTRYPLPTALDMLSSDYQESEQSATGVLFAQLSGLGGFDASPITVDALQAKWSMPALYKPWLTMSLDILSAHGFLVRRADGWALAAQEAPATEALWQAWERRKAKFQDDPDYGATTRLIDAALQALPSVLTGKASATSVLFPNASVSLIEGLYKNNRIVDFFNEVLSEVLITEVEDRLRRDPAARLRVFEIGAGTGGTSALLFERLAPYAAHIEEYCYTDISRAFLLHAQDKYLQKAPYLRTRLFNVEQPLSAQGLELASYDFVVATNVLHATQDMRRTLRNTKALLKESGVLLVNELIAFNLFAHLTTGLLEGWWLYTDSALRIPGSPMLDSETWRFLLSTEGYGAVAFPARDANDYGQQIITARSDGVVRQAVVNAPASAGHARQAIRSNVTAPPALPSTPPASTLPKAVSTAAMGAGELEGKLQAALAAVVSSQLKVRLEDIGGDVTLNELGFDSITLTAFANALNSRYGLDLTPTALFEHPTLAGLSRYLVVNHRSVLQPHFGVAVAQAPVPMPALPAAISAPAMGAGELEGKLQAALAAVVSSQLKVRLEDIGGDVTLNELGFDSITLTAFANALNSRYGLDLTPTALFEHPTLAGLSRYLVVNHRSVLQPHFGGVSVMQAPASEAMGGAPALPSMVSVPKRRRRVWPEPSVVTTAMPSRAGAPEPVAIIGVSGKFPQAADLDELWANLEVGRDSIGEIPNSRWDWSALRDYEGDGGPGIVKYAGLIDGIDEFDPLFFGISPREAESIDPQQRLLLMHAWKAIEDAGYAPHSLSGSQTALFVGTASSGYGERLGQITQTIEGYTSTGIVASIGPNRMSYLLNLHGPSEPVETACSSALVAIHRAVQLLQSGQCELAIAGGVNTLATAGAHISLSKSGMLSPDGRCKTFSDQANGYVRGEGAGMLVLKPLSAAERDGDHIYALIRGTAENHGGKANSLTAPNPRAQADLIKAAIKQSGVELSSIGYIEAHGTGTPLGDPIEVQGLKTAFQELASERQQPLPMASCGLGTIKTNIGHLELAAGVAGVIKVLLQMRHKKLVPSLHCETVNPYIDLEGSPFYVVREVREWAAIQGSDGRPQPRRAGVSSFGFGGVNAHVVLEEYIPKGSEQPPALADEAHPALIVLSAKNGEQLREQARQLLAAVERGVVTQQNLTDTAYTLQVGRNAMEERLALLAGSLDEVKAKLSGYLEGRGDVGGLYRGQIKQSRQLLSAFSTDEDLAGTIETWLSKGKLNKLLELWVQGLGIDWNQLYSGKRTPRRISLPTYPFARDRYWLPEVPKTEKPGTAPSQLHPLVHRNTSDFDEQRYSSRFDGQEFFLSDHVVQGRKVLPAVAYLEMVRAAMQVTVGETSGGIRLKNAVWSRPLVVDGEAVEVHIGLSPQEDGWVAYEVYREAGGHEVISHSQGLIQVIESPIAVQMDVVALRAQCNRNEWAGSECYERFTALGLAYGPAYQAIERLHIGEAQALARLVLPASVVGTREQYVLHPSVFDAALQSLIGLASASEEYGGQPYLPFALEELEVLGGCSERMWALVRLSAGSQAGDRVQKFDVDLCDDEGRVCVRLRAYTTRVLEGKLGAVGGGAVETLLWQPQWQPVPVQGDEVSVYGERLILLCDGKMDVGALSARLGARCERLPEDYAAQAGMLLSRLQALIRSKPVGSVLVQVVVPAEGPHQVSAGLAGLFKSARLENPKLIGQTIAVDQDEELEHLASKLEENAAHPQDIEIRYVEGTRQVLAWSELKGTQPVQPWKAGGVYLITGGLGGLGRIFAKGIAEQAPGATLMLIGRRELDDVGRQQLRELEALGATVQYRAVDVSDRDAVRQLVLQVQEEHEGLNGIVHSAGVLRDSLLMNKTAEELAAVLAPKVAGLINLDEASREIELDCFICFSSTAAVFGNLGQTDHAAANGFMDAYVRYRNGLVGQGLRHGRTVSVNWPLWADGGSQVDAVSQQWLEQMSGMKALGSEAGVDALYRVWGSGFAQAIVMAGDPVRMRQALARPALALPSAAREQEPQVGVQKTTEMSTAQLKDKAVPYFKRLLAETVRLPAQSIETDAPLERYGIDSILVTRLTVELEKSFGALSKTLLFEYQTLDALVGYFLENHRARLIALFKPSGAGGAKPGVKPTAEPVSLPAALPAQGVERRRRGRFTLSSATSTRPDAGAHAKRDIAIIGLAGRYPQARDLKVFWENLRAGKDSITEIPKERWDHSRYFDPDKTKWGTTYSNWGGFIDGVDEFDSQFFNISPREAEFRDPQERLFLQCVHAALEDAGYTRETLGQHPSERAISVYVGAMYEEYQLYGAQEQARGNNLALVGSMASIANRVSYHFNLHGPSLSVDSMCSSSLAALHLACESLRQGQCSMAIAGGVNVTIHPNKYLLLAQGQFISSKGRCESFGAGGDGFIPGEGVGAVILKPLDQAIADGDHIYGVIKATTLNHGGKTNGYTVPNPVAQAEVVAQALKESGIDARTISYLEAHGTGTSLGDPIEITGLSKAFGASAQDHQYCAIGSVKSNIGHCEGAAGIAGLTKVLLQMQHGQLVPSLHSRELNPHIDFAQTPFVVQQELAEWHRPVVEIDGVRREYPRIAGISSFGAGGSNAHVIVEEYTAPLEAHDTERAGPVAVVLSARDEERLREYAQQLLCALSDEGWSDEQLADAAYTLQVGREAMDERLALLADTTEEVKAKLAGYLEGRDDIEGLYRGQIKQTKQLLSAFSTDEDLAGTIETLLLSQGKLDRLLELWVQGLSIDWNQLYGGKRTPRRISLPTYPFARERYWVPQFEGQTPVHALASVAGVGALHPLVQRNTSDFMEQRYSSRFDGGEFFLSDHMVQGQKVLPGVAYLEMARAALQLTLGEMLGGVRLRNVMWLRPLIVGNEVVEVHIGLSPQEDGSVAYEIYRDAGEDEAISFSQGLIEAIESPAARMDVAALRAQCNRGEWAGSECYERFAALGLVYGPAHRAIEQLYVGEAQALARLVLPGSVAGTREQYVLHPSVLDATLQSVAGLVGEEGQGQLALPFAVQEVEVIGGCAQRMWALARPSAGSQAGDRVQKFDIDLCDDEGVVAVRIKGFATRPADTDRPGLVADEGADRLTLLAPVWDVVHPDVPGAMASNYRVLVIGGTPLQQETLQRHYGQVQLADFAAGHSIAEIADALAAHDEFDHLVWIAPSSASLSVGDERLIAAQQEGVLSCFRLIKALLAGGYGGKALEWSVITEQTQAVHRAEANHPVHAGVHGLVGALAKEYPNWKIRLIDAPQGEVWPLEQALALAPDAQGDGWAWRDGQWYRQKLLPAEVAANEVEPYRQGGVYVVIGGAGGIGEAWSEHVIRHHGAQVIWIGRRALDAELQGKIDRLGRVGPAPHYIAADATERASLQRAYDEIKQRFGPIHGVIHSAIVLGDQSLANMDEARFAASLSAKVDVSVRLAQVFAGEALDFVLFFSSLQSFSKAAGQSNYAAGCTFKDAFARSLGQAWPCLVRVMNWGWWGSVGIVASPAYQERMAQLGVASIEPDEGMEALRELLGGRAEQLALLKTTAQAVLPESPVIEAVQVLAPDYPSLIGAIGDTTVELGQAGNEAIEAYEIFEATLQPLLCKLLCGQLQTLGLRAGQQGTIAEIAALLGLRDMYGRWLEQTLWTLAEQGFVRFDGQLLSTEGMPAIEVDATWVEWDRCKAEGLQTPALRAQITLVETTLRVLPDILRGQRLATDVMFPNASMHLVEGIYKHNPVADYFNTVLSDVVVSFIQARLQQDPQAQIRILEIGAGTGGTSAVLFEWLRPYAAHVAEYNYTDLSKAFLFHAEQEYGAANPYLRYQILDIGRPLAEQGVSPGHYDLVVATNVLHATANIRRTVRNAKAALRPHGLVVLNELIRGHILAHLSFGLLEGWWLYEDPELRIAGCPALSAESWRTVLEDEGLGAVSYPVKDKAWLGQQIIVAESDGVARQQRPAAPIRQAAKVSAASGAVRSVTSPAIRQPLVETRREAVVERPAAAVLVAGTVDASASVRDKAVAYFKALLGKTLKLSSHQIDSAQPLETYGIDSILVVSMTTSLQEVFEDVSSTLFFEYRSIDELVTHFLETQPEALAKVLNLAPAGSAPSRAVAAPVQAERIVVPIRAGRRFADRGASKSEALPLPALRARDVAIIGLAGRYPQAWDIDAFWDNLKQGRHCIGEIPAERWDPNLYFDPEKGKAGKSYSKWGGFIDGVDEFDPMFFNIVPLEAEMMDPQERLFLAQAYAGIEDAGYTPGTLSPSGKVGVFAGVMNGYYGSSRYWSIANRVSYLFNFQGPSLAVDTACSSSLTALHLALESLHSGACDIAIAGGVNVIIDPAHYVGLSAMNMLSAGDRCRAFGADADGFVDGEGVGVLVLKSLEQAIADGDHVYGVIKATAINHGGKTNGYTVPNPVAQAQVVARTLQEAGIDARTISYVEAHGTGTSLGDPIEIAGLSKAFGETTQDRQYCAIGSVKSNIGHTESAAGIAGLTKVLLQMKHGQLAPSLHAEQLNPGIDFARTPFVVQRELGQWLRPEVEIDGVRRQYPRRAGISSFGAGGANAHVIVEEYVAADGPAFHAVTAADPALMVLSARDEERLRERARQLLEAIERGVVTQENLADAAYTLQVGREAMNERLALSAGSLDELKAKLAGYLEGRDGIEELYHGQVKRNKEAMALFATDEELQEAVAKWVERKKFAKVLELWVKGLTFDWSTLYAERKPKRISLPTYPFARERYWLSASSTMQLNPNSPPRPKSVKPRNGGFDKEFFGELFEAVDTGLLSVENALTEAHKRMQ